MKHRFPIFLAMTLLLCVGLATAQEDDSSCPTIVEEALDATDRLCAGAGRNEACYGNVHIEWQPNQEQTVDAFSEPGDRVELAAVESLQLNPMDEEAGTWGVALLRMQADIPDTLPGQNVTFLLFGDVQIENAVESDEDRAPMQAFYFQSGVGDAPCEAAPESGILVQTPEGVREVQFTVNGADVTLASTAFLQMRESGEDAPEDSIGDLAISLLEGQGVVEAFGAREVIPAGSWLRMPLNRDFRVFEPPQPAIPYTEGRVARLPLRLLRRRVEVAPPLTHEQIDRIRERFRDAESRRWPGEVVPPAAPGDEQPDEPVTLTLTNALEVPATLTIGEGIALDFAPGETRTVPVLPGDYDVTICAGRRRCTSFVGIIRGDRSYTISRRTFREDAPDVRGDR